MGIHTLFTSNGLLGDVVVVARATTVTLGRHNVDFYSIHKGFIVLMATCMCVLL